MRQIKAIETHYKGFRFRSRLEARWGVFFDTVGLEWTYESEGYKLSDGRWYLPDFEITSVDGEKYIYEIKPTHSKGDGKLELLLKDNDWWGRVISGDPYEFVITRRNYPCPRCMLFTLDADECPIYYEHVQCWPCDCSTPSGGGHPVETHFGIRSYPHKGDVCIILDDDYSNQQKYWDLLKRACKSARAARFEHGEKPRIR